MRGAMIAVRVSRDRAGAHDAERAKNKPKNAGGRLPAASKHRSEREAYFAFLPAFLAVFLAAFFAVFFAAFFAAFFFAAIVGILCWVTLLESE